MVAARPPSPCLLPAHLAEGPPSPCSNSSSLAASKERPRGWPREGRGRRSHRATPVAQLGAGPLLSRASPTGSSTQGSQALPHVCWASLAITTLNSSLNFEHSRFPVVPKWLGGRFLPKPPPVFLTIPSSVWKGSPPPVPNLAFQARPSLLPI